MKTSIAMTPVQIASSVIEKLKEQNRISMNALQKTQNDMRRLERQLIEKEQLIKILEGKVRSGSNNYLEMSNRQKEITIKHLELQIQKLLKENEDLECQINVVKSDICAKCETKYLLGGPVESKPASKSVRKCTLKNAPAKQLSDVELQKREKMLERIIEHKDKRIVSLTKEIHRLNQVEKELSNKVYRLTKLLPMAHMSSEVITECLLKEIHSLEMQIQHYQEKYSKLNVDIGQMNKNSKSYSNLSDLKSKTSFHGSVLNEKADSLSKKLNEKSTTSEKNISLHRENTSNGNDYAVSKLHLLYNDVIELKQLFANENEKLFLNLTKESQRKDLLQNQWKEIMSRLTEITETIESILQTNIDFAGNKSAVPNDKENIILHLQERLKDSIELTTQYENEMAELKSMIQRLEDQVQKDRINHQYTQTDVRRLSNESVRKVATADSADIQHLKDLLKEKQKQLDSSESHLKTYQNFVAQLQGPSKDPSLVKLQQSSNGGSKQTASNANFVDNERFASSTNNVTRFDDQLGSKSSQESSKSWESKLEIAEKNIKTLEDVVENLQKVIKSLKQQNIKLSSEISLAKSNHAASESNIMASLKMKLKQTEEELAKVQSVNKELENNVCSLQEEKSSLQEKLQVSNYKLASLQEASSQQTILQSKLDVSEKKINTLESTIAEMQNTIEELKNDNARLTGTMQISESRKSLEAEDSILALQNKLILKDDEIKTLKESLHAIETKAIEMSHYRRTLRQEIEKLCDALLEKSDPNKSLESRKAIYKAAVLQSAKALLQLDEDYNEQSKDTNKEGALEEMNQQVSVYLTEVARIHELLTVKNQQKDELLKDYLDGNDGVDLPGLASTSGLRMLSASSGESTGGSSASTSSESSANSSNKNVRVGARNVRSQTEFGPKADEEEVDTKSITSYLVSRCSQLEGLLEKEQKEHLISQKETEMLKQSINNLQTQLNSKNSLAKRLNTLIEMMRSKGGSDEIAMEQLRSDIKWLVDENHKVFEKIAFTQTELCKCKEENSRVQNDLDNVKRQLINEKYEHAKVNNELKHLREQLFAKTTFSLSNDELMP